MIILHKSNDNVYYIGRDENGQPFICHAGFLKNAGNAAKNAVGTVKNAVSGGGTRNTKVNDIKEKYTDKKMSKDPKVVEATKKKEKAEAEYDRVKANLEDYCKASGINFTKALNGHTDDPVAKKLADKYWDANDDLRYAYSDYSDATKKYGKKAVFSWQYTDRS